MTSTSPLTSAHYCPRLIDYFLVISSESHDDFRNPCIRKQYPPDNHDDFNLPPETKYFCQPDVGPRDPNDLTLDAPSFVFTLTDKDKNRVRYGICLNFYSRIGPASSKIGLISLCIITHHPMFSGFRRCLDTVKEMINCISGFGRMLSGSPWSPEGFWNLFLFGRLINSDVTVGEASIVYQLEKWILRLVSAPAPIPSHTLVSLTLMPPAVEPPIVFAMPDKSRLSLVDFPFYLPMELLGIPNCLKVILAILLEQKVLLKSMDYNALTMSVLALTEMLYPLQYMFPIIPLLPTSLPGAEQVLMSPTPFLIGIPSGFIKAKCHNLPLSDVWIVDLDSGQITCGESVQQLPDFPTQETKELHDRLLLALDHMKKSSPILPDTPLGSIPQQPGIVDGVESGGSCSASGMDSAADFDADVIDVAMRVAMVRFFNSPNILADFTEHTRTLRLFPRPVVTFQYISFMRSRPKMWPFTQRLVKTQAVEYLSEWCLYPENEVFQRIHAGIFDPVLIGDKAKWFSAQLVAMEYKVYEDSETFIIHLGCCKNRNPWAVENVSLDAGLCDQVDLNLIKHSDQESPNEIVRSMLVDYREHFNAPTSVEEILKISRAMRDRDSYTPSARGRERRSSERGSTAADSDEVYDDIFSANSSSAEEDSEQDDSDIWDLKKLNNTDESTDANATVRESDTTQSETPVNGGIRKPETAAKAPFSTNGSFSWAPREDYTNKENPTALVKPNETADDPKDEDDLEDVTLGMHLLTNISDVFSTILGKSQPQKIIEKSKQLIQSPKLDQRDSSVAVSGVAVKTNRLAQHSNLLSAQAQRRQKALRRLSQSSFDETSSEKQELLKSVIQTIWSGGKVGLRTKHEIQGLMEDEGYRNYLLVKLFVDSHGYTYDPESTVPNVALRDTTIFRNLVWLVKAVIFGYERNWVNRGLQSVGSVFMLLELAHTHFWDQSVALEHEIITSKQRPSSLQSSRENLFFNKTEKNPLGNLVGWVKSTANDFRSGRLISGSTGEQVYSGTSSHRSSVDRRSEDGSASTSVSASASPIWPKTLNAATATPRASFVHSEVILDTPTDFKCRNSGTTRYSNGKLLSCVFNKAEQQNRHQPRYYIFEAIISAKDRSRVWDQPQFWEDAFLDAVARERDLLGLDHDPTATLELYTKLSLPERKLLDLKEDRILASLLHNLIAFMVLLKTSKQDIYNLAYRLFGRCRLGSSFSHRISNLLECVAQLDGNGIDLLPKISENIYRQAFVVFCGDSNSSPNNALIFEIYDEIYLLRQLGGAVHVSSRLDSVVGAVLFVKARVCVLLEVKMDKVGPALFHCRRVKALYIAIKSAMGRISFTTKEVSNPMQFCQQIVAFPDGYPFKFDALSASECVSFSKPKSDLD